jgi:RNA polymerase sigma-70 factor (ECF subfamily)
MIGRESTMEVSEQHISLSKEKQCEQLIKEIIEKYKDSIFNIIYRIISNYDDALELTQEAFLKAMIALPNFRFESSLKTWIYRISVNLALNYKKKWKLFHKKEKSIAQYLCYNRPSPEKSTSDNQLNAIIQKAINALPNDLKAIILLRDIEEFSYTDIAKILNIPIGTVKSRLARARCILKKSLKAYY